MLIFAGLCVAFGLFGAWVRGQADDRKATWFRSRRAALADFEGEMTAWRNQYGHRAATTEGTAELGEIAARLEQRKLEADAVWVGGGRA